MTLNPLEESSLLLTAGRYSPMPPLPSLQKRSPPVVFYSCAVIPGSQQWCSGNTQASQACDAGSIPACCIHPKSPVHGPPSMNAVADQDPRGAAEKIHPKSGHLGVLRPPGVTCPHCGKKGFKNLQSVEVHIGRMHKGVKA